MRRRVWPVGVLFVAACGARTGLLAPEEPADAADASDAAPDAESLDVAQKPDVSTVGCPDAATEFVYVVSEDDVLSTFDPPSATFATIGVLACDAGGANPFSMAVARDGTAYVEYDDGELFAVSTQTAACKPTSFVTGQVVPFGMGYATIGAGPAEQLFIAPNDALATLDVDAGFAIHPIGTFAPSLMLAELTGTGDGRLYAYYATGDFGGSTIGEIDKSNAHVVAADTLANVDRGDAWAFAFWGGDFWIFTAPNDEQTTVKYDPVAKTSTVVAHYASPIVGAGVSTCAPQ